MWSFCGSITTSVFFNRVIEHILLALTAQDGEINKLSKNKKVRIRIPEIIIEELEE